MSISAISGNVHAVTTLPTPAVDPATANQAGQSNSKTTTPLPKHDEVKLTGTALAKSLKLSGQTAAQIAQSMSTDIKTVDSYLGLQAPATAATPAPAPQAATAQAATTTTPAKVDTKA